MRIRGLFNLPWYPLLIALLPVARFYEANFRSFFPSAFVRISVLHLLLAVVLMALALPVWKSRHRAALVVAPLLALLLMGNDLGGWLCLVMLAAAVGLGIFLARRRPNLWRVTPPLNAAFLVLVILPLVNAWWIDRGEQAPTPTRLFGRDLPSQAVAGGVKPDIWFLLVDGLGAPSIVEKEFGVPGSDYSDQLRRRGFKVPETSFSNYEQTGLSLSATWNVAHIPALLDVPDTSSRDRRVLYGLIGNSRIARALGDLGYRTVDLPSSYPMTRLQDAVAWPRPFLAPGMVEFAIMEKGILPVVQPLLGRGPADVSFALRRRNLNYIFDHLADARAEVSPYEPAFVFAHILAPHPPFVFDASGAAVRSEADFGFFDGSHWLDRHGWAAGHYPQKYSAQAVYVMKRVGEAVDRILAQAMRPTVIIIQGDHGSGSRLDWERPRHSDHRERFSIMNAWYLPRGMEADLPEGVSSLSTFPILFHTLFGIELPTPPPGQLISRWSRPYIFFEVKE